MNTKEQLKQYISSQLTRYRLQHDLTQHQLAELCEIDDRTYANMERQISLPSALTLYKIKEKIGLDLIPDPDILRNKKSLNHHQTLL